MAGPDGAGRRPGPDDAVARHGPAPGRDHEAVALGRCQAESGTAYTSVARTVLRQGSSGAAVKVLQRALGGLAVDGAYGPRTTAAVKAFQKRTGSRSPA